MLILAYAVWAYFRNRQSLPPGAGNGTVPLPDKKEVLTLTNLSQTTEFKKAGVAQWFYITSEEKLLLWTGTKSLWIASVEQTT